MKLVFVGHDVIKGKKTNEIGMSIQQDLACLYLHPSVNGKKVKNKGKEMQYKYKYN